MLEPIELKAHPYCTDCLAWSADGQLAVAAGEFVFILTPKYVGSVEQAARNGDPKIRWETVKLQVNQFTYEEWPQVRHQPLHSFSPGEELSNSHVTNLAWSPDEVGPFRLPVLAIQTSNLLLSIWGLEDGNTRWKRLMVVNQSLQSHFQPLCGNDRVLLQKRQRIRSFSWNEPDRLTIITQKDCEQQQWFYMAIANDNREIVFLRLDPEKRSTSGVRPLKMTVVDSFVVEELDVDQSCLPIRPGSILSNVMTSKPCISQVMWSGWLDHNKNDDQWLSTVAMLDGMQPRMYHITLQIKEETTVSTSEARKKTLNPDSVFFSHKHVPIKTHADVFTGPLCHIPRNEVFYYSLGRPGDSARIDTRLPLDGDSSEEEDQVINPAISRTEGEIIAGDRVIAARAIRDTNEAVHVAGHLGRVCTQENHLHVGRTHLDREEYDVLIMSIKSGEDLQRRIEAFRSTFDLDYDLGGKSVARIWGLAKYRPRQRHSLDDNYGRPDEYTAACFTLHPTEMAEHSMPSEALMRIVISSTSDVDHDAGYVSDNDRRPPRTSISFAEPLFNFLQFIDVDDDAKRTIRHEIMANDAKCTRDVASSQKDPLLRMILYAHACCGRVDFDEPYQITRRVLSLRPLVPMDLDEFNDIGGRVHRGPVKAKEIDCALAALTYEKCTICGSGIPWQSPVWGRCTSGHLFNRCGITMLCIQDPALSKCCSGCGTEFLDETKIMSIVPWDYIADAESRPDSPSSEYLDISWKPLSRTSDFVDKLMGAICDLCPYCGSNYFVN